MTLYMDPSQGTMDAYDHTGAQIATDVQINSRWARNDDGVVVDPPQEFLDACREAMDGDQPSAYNQAMFADIITRNVIEGTPP